MSDLPWLGLLFWPKLLRGRRRSVGQRITRAVFLVVGVAIAVGIYGAALWFLRLCYEVEVVGPLLCRRLLDLVLLVLLSVLLLSNLVTALNSFFLAKDLDLLVAAPIAPRTFFTGRFVEQLTHSSWMVLAFGLPVLLAFARVAGGRDTYLAVAVALPPLLVMPAAVAALVTLVLVSSLPAVRVRDIVVGLLFIAFIVLYLVARLVEPERFLNPEGFASMVRFLASFSQTSSPLLPSHWATSVIGATFRDATGAGPFWLMLAALWTGAAASHAVVSFAHRRLYSGAFSRSQEGRRVAKLSRLWARLRGVPLPVDGAIRSPRRRGAEAEWLRAFGRPVPAGPLREFVIKDLKLMLRDASQWSQLVLLLALMFVYLYNFRYFRVIGESGIVGRFALFLIAMGLSSFVTAAVSVRFAFPLISLEGHALWLLCSAPLWPRQILWAKVVATVPPLLIVAEVMAIASAVILGASWQMLLLSALVAALTGISVASMATGMGAVLPDYRADSAANVASSFGGLVCMSLSLIISFVFVALAIYPAYLIYYQRPITPLTLLLCVGGALATCAISVGVPLWLGARALDRYELG